MAAKGGAVGFFDSGLGGLCILDAFKALCPHESTIYIADSKNCPYGNKPAAEIVKLAESNTRRLLRRGCKMVVVACNTATAAAIDTLRAEWPDVPFIGIEPAVKPTVIATVADEFVELVERKEISGVAAERVVRARIEPLLKAGCDKIVLGCTHFPHLKPLIEKICDGRAEVIDPSDAVARQARRVLSARGLAASASAKPSHIFIRT